VRHVDRQFSKQLITPKPSSLQGIKGAEIWFRLDDITDLGHARDVRGVRRQMPDQGSMAWPRIVLKGAADLIPIEPFRINLALSIKSLSP
jgi:hypothetical protein